MNITLPYPEPESDFENMCNRVVELNATMWPHRTTQDMNTMQAIISQCFEEGGELHGALRSYFGREYNPEKKGSIEDVADELGDVISLYILIAAIMKVPLNLSMKMVIAKLERRLERMKVRKLEYDLYGVQENQ